MTALGMRAVFFRTNVNSGRTRAESAGSGQEVSELRQAAVDFGPAMAKFAAMSYDIGQIRTGIHHTGPSLS